ncbi:hypothetical protein BH10BAC2_BH10BAC2_49020 [soil metagenome]
MRKFLIFCLLLSIAGKVFSQADTAMPQSSIKTDYLKKSKTQKTVAWVLLGAGTSMIVGGIIAGRNAVDDVSFDEASNGAALIGGGLVVDLVSIPFFISGARNKGRAMSVTMRNDFVPQLQRNALVSLPLPTVRLVIRL